MDISWVYNIDPLLATLLMSMLPVLELRAAIPVAMSSFDISWINIFVVSVVGSFIPAIFIVYFLGPISDFFRKIKLLDRFFDWLFKRTRAKFDKKYALWGNLALMFFVAIPLPGTGVWTGSLAAWLFNFNKKQALVYIAIGTFIAAIIVMLISIGAFKIFDFLIVNRQ